MGNSLHGFCHRYSCCCCCCLWCCDQLDETGSDGRFLERRRRREWSPRPMDLRASTSIRQSFPTTCNICGIVLDPVLLDGHRETCRVQHRQQMQRQAHPLIPNSQRGSLESDSELCLVCLDAPRMYAFLPCGHVSCCAECAKPLDCCPLCREPRKALCLVAKDTILQQFRCPHCMCIIAPTLYDGHREVCALRTREARALPSPDKETGTLPTACVATSPVVGDSTPVSGQATGASSLSDSLKNPTNSTSNNNALVVRTTGILRECLECHGTESPLVFLLPCGHRVLCRDCAIKRVTCPLCLRDVESVGASFT
ncbi:uncharacterized protein TM35_000064700 [Trypanosoma theileri]|uniref:RING-type domain-containing protein n=1 Tax=Trypanosoma theileri TaxID=67003 RepID=A0A1X0P3L1_9TRYP|nr:uncharacterized protein TM35_000064700 [Trypanosoma theileri]ORC91465.1 hypothetical protein TM35_000064700 [Trypanosoma theileri]